jgi:atypical dual specificity phosphatase
VKPGETVDSGEDEPELVVRPKGYVEDSPVIRRVGGRNLYLGNESAASPEGHDRSFEFVLSATDEEHPLTTHHRPLIDGSGNEWSAFQTAVDTGRRLYRRKGSVLIHCKAGISRSSTLIAAVLAAEEHRPFRDALGDVQDARPAAMPHPVLHELAVVYLAAKS